MLSLQNSEYSFLLTDRTHGKAFEAQTTLPVLRLLLITGNHQTMPNECQKSVVLVRSTT